MPGQRVCRTPEPQCLRQGRAAEDGRSFADESDGAPGSVNYWRVRQEARPYALRQDRFAAGPPAVRLARGGAPSVRAAATMTS
ncbi:hypothetical protein [Streptomyces sp900116325]|uniref:hypothetical protein n=1 Tax=Streptomyces sp. 900116325 TaxID=3154295 RepID=UPI0033CF4EBE